MTTEKILLRTDDRKVSDLIRTNTNAVNALNTMIDYFKTAELEVPDFTTLKKIIESECSEDVVSEYVQTLYTDQPKKLRDELQFETMNDIISFTVGRTERNYEFVEVKRGKAQMIDGAADTIRERFSTFISEPEQIERYQRLQTIVQQLNQLGEELREANKGYFGVFNPISIISPTETGNWAIDWRVNF